MDHYENQQSRTVSARIDGTNQNVPLYDAMSARMLSGCYNFADVPYDVTLDITFLPDLFDTLLIDLGTSQFPQYRQVCFPLHFELTFLILIFNVSSKLSQWQKTSFCIYHIFS